MPSKKELHMEGHFPVLSSRRRKATECWNRLVYVVKLLALANLVTNLAKRNKAFSNLITNITKPIQNLRQE